MRKALQILFFIVMIMFCGCGKKTAIADPQSSGVAETAADSSISGTQEESEDEILLLWKKDITLQDPFVPTMDLSSIPFQELSTDVKDAVPVSIRIRNMELVSDQIAYEDGGVGSEYAVCEITEEIQREYPVIGKDLTTFNEFAEQNAVTELEEGEVRHKAYRSDNEISSFLFLNSWTGIEINRADSGILSYFRTVYRYNREYEPDYYEVYGRTIDSVTGRVLSLNDVFTDTEELPFMIWESLVSSGQREESDPDKEAFIEIIRTAINGCREDGCFGWTLSPLGIEFALIESVSDIDSIRHVRERAFISYSRCGEILRQNIAQPVYDSMVLLTRNDVETVFGKEIPVSDDDWIFNDFYIVQKGGTQFFYCTSEDHTDVYRISEDEFSKVGEVSAEIGFDHYDHIAECLSPDHYKLRKTAHLLQELFLEAPAHTDENGMPVRDEYYSLTTSPMPITTGRSFEAEVFSDLNDNESSTETVEENTVLFIVRTDGENILDCSTDSNDRIVRLIVSGSDTDGWTVNGFPMEDVIAHQGWWEE